jgi:hypothetical protein
MTPKVIAILVAIVLIIVIGMVLTVKRAAQKQRDRTVATEHRGQTPNLTHLVHAMHPKSCA